MLKRELETLVGVLVRDGGSVTKSISCSCRGHRDTFSSQHLPGDSQTPATPVPGDLAPLLTSMSTRTKAYK